MWQEQHYFSSPAPYNTDVTEEKVELCMRRVIGQVQRSHDSHPDESGSSACVSFDCLSQVRL